VISFLRNRLQGIVAFSFLGIVALTFAFLGLPTFTQAVSNNEYATIDEYKISQSEYFSIKSSIQERLRDNNEQMSAEELEAEINNQLIDKYTKIHFIDEIGIIVPDSFAENELSKDPQFQDNGEFSNEIFKNYLVNNNLTKYDLIDDLKNNYKANFAEILFSLLANSYQSSTDGILERIYERRTVQYVKLDAENVTKEFSLTDDELMNYYQLNKNQFFIPEKASFYTVIFNEKALNLKATEEDVRAAYDQYLSNLPTPEKKVAHIMLLGSNYENEDLLAARVKEVENALSNISFSDAVAKYSEDTGTLDIGGELGFTNGEVFPPEFEKKIEELQLNEISVPIEFDGNTHFLKITEVESINIASFDEKKLDLASEIIQIEYEDKINEFSQMLSGKSYDLSEVETFANSFSLELNSYEELSLTDIDISSENGKILFQTNAGTWSDPLQISPKEHIFAFVLEKIPSTYENYQTVKETIVSLVLRQKKNSYLEEIYVKASDIPLEKELLINLYSIDDFKVDQLNNINFSTSLLSNEIKNVVFSEHEVDIVKKELLEDGLLFYSVSNRTKGDLSVVPEEIYENTKLINEFGIRLEMLQKLRNKYGFDDKLVISQEFINQNS
tara:strand:+ start:1672 stop:3519 length:1848 start_codon:yes stop_codon:yes gene_type:complete